MEQAQLNRELVKAYQSGDASALDKLCAECQGIIAACAGELCRKLRCAHLHEDLTSVGMVTLLEQIGRYDANGSAELTTFLHPHIMGAMRREIEEQLGCVKLPKREFQLIRKVKALHILGYSVPEIAEEIKVTVARAIELLWGSLYYSSLEAMEDDDEYPPKPVPDTALPVHRLVYLKICTELMEEEFQKLSFKERELLGGFYGVFGHEERTLSDLGEQFQLKENAVLKARDKALKKLAENCLAGKLGLWRDIYRAVMECAWQA